MSIAAVNAPLAGRLARPAGTVVSAGGVDIGGPGVVVIAGPCAVEDEAQSLSTGEFAALMPGLAAIAAATGRSLA